MHLLRRFVLIALACLLAGGASLFIPGVYPLMRGAVKAVVRPEPPAPITPLAMRVPQAEVAMATPIAAEPAPRLVTFDEQATSTSRPTATEKRHTPTRTATPRRSATARPTATIAPTTTPLPTATAAPIVINGRVYDTYIPTANKEGQRYKYSCEFDAAWAILQTYGVDVSVDDLITAMEIDRNIEPYIEETGQGFIIHGGDIDSAFSGDYTANFLARSTGSAIRPVFEQYGMIVWPVRDRTGVEAALRVGALVWMKTTVDFKPWRPATWLMPDGSTHQTVLGNDHAVVVMGFNEHVVVIRDVLGPTSSNWQRPYEYEVAWSTFLAAWEAQSFDGLAVIPAAQ